MDSCHYVVLALGAIQEQALGAEAGARHIARVVATAADADDADDRADAVLRSVAEEYGMDADDLTAALSCRPKGAACPDAGTTVVVTVRTRVALPFVPAVLGLDRLASVPIEATAVQKVSRFWGSGG